MTDANHTDPSSASLHELSLAELEAAVLARRQESTRDLMQRITAAQGALADEPEELLPEEGLVVRPPEGEGAAAYLHPGDMQPLARAVAARERNAARRRNSILLFAELALLLGFVVVIGLTFERMQLLNQEVQRLRVATPEPPPILPTPTPVRYLPGGRPAGAQTDSVAYVAQAPPTPKAGEAQRLVIPAINVDAVVVPGDDWEALKQGIGHRLGTANPGETGNMVVSAHNDIYGEIFRDLYELQPGDEVLAYTASGAFRYIVNNVALVEPTAVEVLAPTAYPALTMISCYPYLVDTQRVVVTAELAP